MKKSSKPTIGAAFRRGLITTSFLTATLAVQAQVADVDKPKHETDSSHYTSRAGDKTSCLQEAAKMNLATIRFAQLAAEKAESADLKSFGQTLERDHKKAQSKLETIAQKHNVTLPTSVDPKCEEELTKLRSLTGAEFDKEFAKGAVEGHAMALAHLQQASKESKDADISQYVSDRMARVRDHQRQARQVAKTVGVDQSTISSLESKANEGVGSSGATSETSRESKGSTESDTQPATPKR